MYESRFTVMSAVPDCPAASSFAPEMPTFDPVWPGGPAMRLKYEPVFAFSSDHATLIVPVVPLSAFHRMRT
jgi:hypothetical protein